MAEFVVSIAEKLEVKISTTYTQLKACTQIPQIGQAADRIETTTLDNTKLRTYTKGLQDSPSLEFPFNLESPAATANINLVAGLDPDTIYEWKVTKSSGIVHEIKSKPDYYYNQVGVNELETFTLVLNPEEEITTTVPSVSL